MPAISLDTFFACSLMVLLMLSAMAATTKLLYPSINGSSSEVAERYRKMAQYILLNAGNPPNWGQDGQNFPEEFGLAKAGAENVYTLDIDKVSRLNGLNVYALSYAQMFTGLKMPDVSFSIEIKPVFETRISLTATFRGTDETMYQFEVSTEKDGVKVPTNLKLYIIAEDFLESSNILISDGAVNLNVTIPNSINGPALLVVFARYVYNDKMFSFASYAFTHNAQKPEPSGTFLQLSPLNYTLTVQFKTQETVLSKFYALAFNYSSEITPRESINQSAVFSFPKFLDSSPTVLVITGKSAGRFFVECTAYPQVPLQVGASFSEASSLSDVFAYSHLVSINRAVYVCTLWFGGPKL
ncbi:hypothetical protein KEJ45_06590 [Candidatus Bathyarchaeota archaeon]|nr:hypothetical protein [Candidatus Bathyarchaeota archaeon]